MKLFIIDGYSLIYRAYYSFINKPLTDKNGENISAYYGFFNTLFMLIREYKIKHLAITFDHKDPTFRHEMYTPYKATRAKAPEDLHAQIPYILETLDKIGIKYHTQAGFEADDIIASLTKQAKERDVSSVMITADKDLLQLVCDKVQALRPSKTVKGTYDLYDEAMVIDKFGLRPDQIVDYLSILGDASDNIPGIKGIGEKGAVKLLTEYETLDGVYRHVNVLSKGLQAKLESGKADAYLSKELVTLKFDVVKVDDFSFYSVKDYAWSASVPLFNKFACYSLAKSAQAKAGDSAVVSSDEEDDETSSKVDEKYLGLGQYTLLGNTQMLKAYLEDAARGQRVFSLKFYENYFAFSYSLKKAFCVAINTESIQMLKTYIEERKLLLIAHNLKELMKECEKHGLKGINYFDTSIASWQLDSSSSDYSLKRCSDLYLDYVTLDDITEDVNHLSEEADIVYRLYSVLVEKLGKQIEVFNKYELPLVEVLYNMEKEGLKIDKTYLAELEVKYQERKDNLVNQIYSIAGKEFNINSPLQLGKVLYEERGLVASKKTQRGYSTDTPTLETLLESGDEIIKYIIEYRVVTKLLSTYIQALAPLADDNDRIHTSFIQTGTATGRLSSRNPNLQNIPIRTDEGRLIRNAFIPKDGCVLLSADYSQIELVILAAMSQDENLMKAFSSGVDVHKYTASLIFEKDIDDVTPAERRTAKTINFGIIYGMSAFRLSNEISVSRKDASMFIERYFERYHGVKEYLDSCLSKAAEEKEVTTLFGHKRAIVGLDSKNKNVQQGASRMAFNTIIQGTAAQVMKTAMCLLNEELKKYKSKMILQVHDELIFEVEKDEVEELKVLIKSVMENAVKLSVNLTSSVEVGQRWGDLH